MLGLLKQAVTLDITSPDTCQFLKPPFEPVASPQIHPCYNQPLVSRPNFRLDTNSTVLWLYGKYAGGVSLILPDVQLKWSPKIGSHIMYLATCVLLHIVYNLFVLCIVFLFISSLQTIEGSQQWSCNLLWQHLSSSMYFFM